VGNPGAAKTTAGRLVLRAMEPTAGQVFFRRENEMVELN